MTTTTATYDRRGASYLFMVLATVTTTVLFAFGMLTPSASAAIVTQADTNATATGATATGTSATISTSTNCTSRPHTGYRYVRVTSWRGFTGRPAVYWFTKAQFAAETADGTVYGESVKSVMVAYCDSRPTTTTTSRSAQSTRSWQQQRWRRFRECFPRHPYQIYQPCRWRRFQ